MPLLSPAIYGALDRTGAAIVQSIHNYRPVCPSANLFRDGRDCTDCVGRRFAWPAIQHACYRDSRAQSAVVAASLFAGRVTGAWERAVDRFIAPSQAVADTLAGPALPRDRIAIKPNFVGTDPGSGPPDDRPDTYLFAGRLAPEKGIATLAGAWDLLGDSPAICRIAGSGPLDELVATAAAGNPRFVPLGSLDRPTLFDEFRRARALIFPSIWREPFGLTIVEAFASGTPVIAARFGAPAELVEEGATGLFFRPGDAAGLAAQVRWASAHPDEMAAMGRRARAVYEHRYDAETNYDMLIEVYRQALGHRRGRGTRSGAGTSGHALTGTGPTHG
jgi:glycosyltransferase involved in cell wall biosynthesis